MDTFVPAPEPPEPQQVPHRPQGQTVTFKRQIPYLVNEMCTLRANKAGRLVPRIDDGDEDALLEHSRLLLTNFLAWVADWTLQDSQGAALAVTVPAALAELTAEDVAFLSWRGLPVAERLAALARQQGTPAASSAGTPPAGDEEGTPYADPATFPVERTA